MTSTPVRVLLTMDCERVKDNSFYPAGPGSWEESARNVSAFADIASNYGCRVTYFAVPEAIEAHAALFRSLAAQGHDVGLHLHPNSFRYGVNEYLANLPADLQQRLLSDACHVFEAAMGFPPTSFRPGHFSANATTFKILASLGFRRTSATIPGRHLHGTGGDWTGWPRHCHRVESLFEAPVTVHHLSASRLCLHSASHAISLAIHGFAYEALRIVAGVVRGRKTFGTVQDLALVDLRIEEGPIALLQAIIRAEIDRMKAHGHLPVLTAITHSYVNFLPDDRRSPQHGMSRRRHLTRMLQCLTPKPGIIESRTLSELHTDFDSWESTTTAGEAEAARTV